MAAIFKALDSDLLKADLKRETSGRFINFEIFIMRVVFHSALALSALFATETLALKLEQF